MPDAFELGFDVARGRHIAVGQVAEVELERGLHAPFERHLVDGDGALAALASEASGQRGLS